MSKGAMFVFFTEVRGTRWGEAWKVSNSCKYQIVSPQFAPDLNRKAGGSDKHKDIWKMIMIGCIIN